MEDQNPVQQLEAQNQAEMVQINQEMINNDHIAVDPMWMGNIDDHEFNHLHPNRR